MICPPQVFRRHKRLSRFGTDRRIMLTHTCGHEMEIYCKRCNKPLIHNPRLGLYCPQCGREVTMICPGCGQRW